MPRKKKKPEEPLPEKTSEEKPAKKPIIWPVHNDDKRKEADDIEHIQRMVNIKYGTQDVRKITKVIVYSTETRKILDAFYKVDLKG